MNKSAKNSDLILFTKQMLHGNFILHAVPIEFFDDSALNTCPEFRMMLIVIAFIETPTYLEAASGGVKKMFLKILQSSQENNCARVSLLKKRLWHRCFPVNFAKFLRTPFLQNTSRRLLPHAE